MKLYQKVSSTDFWIVVSICLFLGTSLAAKKWYESQYDRLNKARNKTRHETGNHYDSVHQHFALGNGNKRLTLVRKSPH